MQKRVLRRVEGQKAVFNFPFCFVLFFIFSSFLYPLVAAEQEPPQDQEEYIQEDPAPIAPGRRLTSGGLDLDEMQSLIQRAYPKIETAANKNIVLVLGNLGAGKSSIVDYLLGCRMRAENRGTRRVAVPEEGQQVYAPIGHSFEAQTLFPEVYTNGTSSYFYCDCPGFEDNRTLEERICASISTQMAINKASSVKVMVVIDNNSFRVDRAASFRKLSNTLSKLFSRLDHFDQQEEFPFLFVINKADPWVEAAHVVADIREIISAEDTTIATMLSRVQGRFRSLDSERRREIQNTRTMLGFLNFMLQGGESNIHVIDVFDTPHHLQSSRQEIETALSSLPSIGKESFNFERYDDMRVKFNEVIYKIIEDSTGILKEKREIPQRIRYYDRAAADANRRVDFYVTQLATGNFSISINRDRIQELTTAMERSEAQRQGLEGRIQGLNRIDAVKYWEDSINEERFRILWLFSNPFSWSEKEFRYTGIPFMHSQESAYDTGRFLNKAENPATGAYSSRYESNRGSDGRAKVEIFIPFNQSPDIVTTLTDLQGQRGRLNSHIQWLRNSRAQYENEDRATETQRRSQFERGQRRFEQLRRMFEESRNVAQELLPRVEQDYENNANLIRTTYNIVTNLTFESPLVNIFINLYEHLDQPEDIEPNLSPNLIDPISADPLIDPVQTRCEHPFNRLEITAWLQSGHDSCPICRASVRETDLVPIPALAEMVVEQLRL